MDAMDLITNPIYTQLEYNIYHELLTDTIKHTNTTTKHDTLIQYNKINNIDTFFLIIISLTIIICSIIWNKLK
jgi:hypothetical protein